MINARLLRMTFLILGIGILGTSTYPISAYAGENMAKIEKEDSKNQEPVLFKKGSISSSVGLVLYPLLERIWATMYYQTPSEVLAFSENVPLCQNWPDGSDPSKREQNSKNFIWSYNCTPIDMTFKKNNQDGSGIIIVRMLDFGQSSEVLQESFKVIQDDDLGRYRISTARKEEIKKVVQEKYGSRKSKMPINYAYNLRTYFKLEGYSFLSKENQDDIEITSDPMGVRKILSDEGKKYSLALQYDPQSYSKNGNIVEFVLTTPPMFFQQ